jgi:hypothetical protein
MISIVFFCVESHICRSWSYGDLSQGGAWLEGGVSDFPTGNPAIFGGIYIDYPQKYAPGMVYFASQNWVILDKGKWTGVHIPAPWFAYG